MRRLLAALVLAFLPAIGQAQINVSGSGSGSVTSPISGDFVSTGKWTWGASEDSANSIRLGETAGCIAGEGASADGNETFICFGDATADGTLRVTAGTSGAVTVTTAASDLNLSATSGVVNFSGGPYFTVNGATGYAQVAAGFGLCSSNSGASNTTCDTFLKRSAAAVWQLGVDLNGNAIDQVIQSANGITGTDNAGADFTHASGKGTGTGLSSVILQSPTRVGTGTTAQVLANRLLLNDGAVVFGGTAPTVSSCGTSPSTVSGSSFAGRLTTGSGGTVQSCTLTFVPALAAAPACMANNETVIILLRTVATTTTLVIDAAVAGTMESDVITYLCFGGV